MLHVRKGHVHVLCTSGLSRHTSRPPTIILLHHHSNYIMSSIEDPKQLTLRTGQLSNNALGINAPPSPAHKSAPSDPSVHYTCFIRLPFCRGDFVDPPQVFIHTSEMVVRIFLTLYRLTGIRPKIVHYGRSFPKLQTVKSWTVCIYPSLPDEVAC